MRKIILLGIFIMVSLSLFSQSTYKTQAYCLSHKVPYLDTIWTEWSEWEPIDLKIFVGSGKIRIFEKTTLVKSIKYEPYKLLEKYDIMQTYFITDELDNFHLFMITLNDDNKLIGMKLYYLVETQTYQLYIRNEYLTICYEMVKVD